MKSCETCDEHNDGTYTSDVCSTCDENCINWKPISNTQKISIVFDGPPGHESGRFVEVENEEGQSIRVGEWRQREDGYWCLDIVAVVT